MKTFVLLFRMDITDPKKQPSKKQMEQYMRQWMLWINEIEDNGQLANGGNHLSREGRVLKPKGQITHKPYTEDTMSVAGYIILTADSIDEATNIAAKCPILNGDQTSVEIRETALPGM